MDLSMPVLNGEDATVAILKLIREEKQKSGASSALEDTSIVAVTSHTNSKVEENCLHIGMKAVFNKPLGLKDLKKIMEKHFQRP